MKIEKWRLPSKMCPCSAGLFSIIQFTFVAIFFLPKNLRRRGSQKDPTEGWKWLNCAAFLLDYHHNNKRCCCERFHIRWKILVGNTREGYVQVQCRYVCTSWSSIVSLLLFLALTIILLCPVWWIDYWISKTIFLAQQKLMEIISTQSWIPTYVLTAGQVIPFNLFYKQTFIE